MSILREFGITVLVMLVVPLAFLIVDYTFRFAAAQPHRTLDDSLVEASNDCCVLSLGGSAAVFVDPRVKAVPELTSPLTVIVIVVIILALRAFCLASAKSSAASRVRTCIWLGSASLMFVVVILAAGYYLGSST